MLKKRTRRTRWSASLDFDVDTFNVGFRARPSFRDFGAFVFQPQNVVANPDILFYKADTSEHREKLRTIFPYVLNAITAELMAKQHELARLRRELRRKQHELSTVKEISERWMAEIQARISEARELGLIKAPISSMGRDELVDTLAEVVRISTDEIRVIRLLAMRLKNLWLFRKRKPSFLELSGLVKG